MLKTNFKALLIFLPGLFLCLGLSSCSTESDSRSETSADIRVLKRGNGSDPESLDPQLARSESALNIVRDLYEGLLTRNAKGELVAGIAERWQFNPDDQCYRFYLRTDAKWSNGQNVVAHDFIRAFQYAVDPKNASPYSSLLKSINNVEDILSGVLSPNQIDVWSGKERELNVCMQGQPPAYVLDIFALPVTFPRHVGTGKKQHLQNGAYYLADRIVQDTVYLKKNPHFHSKDRVYFDEVHYVSTEDANSELKRYLAGELDVTSSIPPNDVKRLEKSQIDEVKIAPVLNTYFYGFNQTKPPFNNAGIRKALSLVVDQELLAKKVLGSGEIAAWTLVPPLIANYPSVQANSQTSSREKQISLAKSLYTEAGYTKEQPLKFELRYNSSSLHKKVAIALSAMWKEHLGVEVELYNEEWKVFVQSRRQKSTQMFRSGWIADVNDASNYLELFTTDHPLNDYGYSNQRFDELLQKAQSATSKRSSILRAAEEQLLEDSAIIPLYFYVSKHLVQSHIKGWKDNILDVHLSRYLYQE